MDTDMSIKPTSDRACIVGSEIELPYHKEYNARVVRKDQKLETSFEFINVSGFRWKLKISDFYVFFDGTEYSFDLENPNWYFDGVEPLISSFYFSISADNGLSDFIFCSFKPEKRNPRSIFTKNINRMRAFVEGFDDGCLLMDNLTYASIKKVQSPNSDNTETLGFWKPIDGNSSLNLYLDKSSPCGYRLENEGDENILSVLNDMNVFTDPCNPPRFESLALLHDMA